MGGFEGWRPSKSRAVRQKPGRRAIDCPDAHRRGLLPAMHPEGRGERIGLCQQVASFPEEDCAIVGQCDTARRALHQPGPEVLFEQTEEFK